jgi:hypothetical protein
MKPMRGGQPVEAILMTGSETARKAGFHKPPTSPEDVGVAYIVELADATASGRAGVG